MPVSVSAFLVGKKVEGLIADVCELEDELKSAQHRRSILRLRLQVLSQEYEMLAMSLRDDSLPLHTPDIREEALATLSEVAKICTSTTAQIAEWSRRIEALRTKIDTFHNESAKLAHFVGPVEPPPPPADEEEAQHTRRSVLARRGAAASDDDDDDNNGDSHPSDPDAIDRPVDRPPVAYTQAIAAIAQQRPTRETATPPPADAAEITILGSMIAATISDGVPMDDPPLPSLSHLAQSPSPSSHIASSPPASRAGGAASITAGTSASPAAPAATGSAGAGGGAAGAARGPRAVLPVFTSTGPAGLTLPPSYESDSDDSNDGGGNEGSADRAARLARDCKEAVFM